MSDAENKIETKWGRPKTLKLVQTKTFFVFASYAETGAKRVTWAKQALTVASLKTVVNLIDLETKMR